MPGGFIDVFVEEHDELPDGCMMRFHAVEDPRPVELIRYAPLIGPEGLFRVEARHSDGRTEPARVAPVEDSGAGTSMLIFGGDHGLRLFRVDEEPAPSQPESIAEPYLLLAQEALVK